MKEQFPIALMVVSTSCDRYLYLFNITDFDDLVNQLTEKNYEFQTGYIEDVDIDSNGKFDDSAWCSDLDEICQNNRAEEE